VQFNFYIEEQQKKCTRRRADQALIQHHAFFLHIADGENNFSTAN